MPGLIEGAHRGQGLGHQFLRHLERTKVLVHLVDVSSASGRDPVDDLDTVRRELELFQPTLAAKPQIVAANKIDALDAEHEERARPALRSGAPASSTCRSSGSPACSGRGRAGAARSDVAAACAGVAAEIEPHDRVNAGQQSPSASSAARSIPSTCGHLDLGGRRRTGRSG